MNDVKGYIECLGKSMTRKEKLFFLNKVKWNNFDCVVDFGGADGRLLYEVDKYLTAHGKDKDKKIQLFNIESNADIKQTYDYNRQYFHAFSLDTWKPELSGKRVLLILSSVVHEIDYETRMGITAFAEENADAIVVRDMYFVASGFTLRRERKKAKLFIEHQNDFLSTDERRLFSDIYRKTLYDHTVKNLYHFFLKYTYADNWAHERGENYFNDNLVQLTQDLRRVGFKIKYHKHYLLPYKKKEVLQHFGYKMRAKTHVKVILVRKKAASLRQIKRKLKR